jgi:quercetin dioxygenase-like cupin family protein
MHISALHDKKDLSVVPLKKNGEGTLIAIHLDKNGELKKHQTAVSAVLVCVSGSVQYETIEGERTVLNSGDFVHIAPTIEHWLLGLEESELLLMK